MPKAGPPLNYDALRVIRDIRGLDVKDLADALGITGGHLSSVETGNRGLSRPRVDKAAEVLNVPVLALLARVECETCRRRAS